MYKYLSLVVALVITSCSNSNDASTPSQKQEIETTSIVDTPKNVPVIQNDPPEEIVLSEEELIMKKRVLNVKSYVEYKRNYFKIGDNRMNLIRVQGNPDFTEQISETREVYYYGECEVHLLNGYVSKVVNRHECLKCLLLSDILGSSDLETRAIGARILRESKENRN